MNPLEAIRIWHSAGDNDMKQELFILTGSFHFDVDVNTAPVLSEMPEAYEKFMDSSSLNRDTIMQRSIFLKGLISYGLHTRGTEKAWEETKQNQMLMAEKIRADGHTDLGPIDRFLETYEERKNKWVTWANGWQIICNEAISDSNLSYWYFIQSNPSVSSYSNAIL